VNFLDLEAWRQKTVEDKINYIDTNLQFELKEDRLKSICLIKNEEIQFKLKLLEYFKIDSDLQFADYSTILEEFSSLNHNEMNNELINFLDEMEIPFEQCEIIINKIIHSKKFEGEKLFNYLKYITDWNKIRELLSTILNFDNSQKNCHCIMDLLIELPIQISFWEIQEILKSIINISQRNRVRCLKILETYEHDITEPKIYNFLKNNFSTFRDETQIERMLDFLNNYPESIVKLDLLFELLFRNKSSLTKNKSDTLRRSFIETLIRFTQRSQIKPFETLIQEGFVANEDLKILSRFNFLANIDQPQQDVERLEREGLPNLVSGIENYMENLKIGADREILTVCKENTEQITKKLIEAQGFKKMEKWSENLGKFYSYLKGNNFEGKKCDSSRLEWFIYYLLCLIKLLRNIDSHRNSLNHMSEEMADFYRTMIEKPTTTIFFLDLYTQLVNSVIWYLNWRSKNS